jgi:hypothetical protein
MTPLHQLGDLLRNGLAQLPLPVVRGLFLALPLLILIWVLTLPAEVTRPPDSKGGWFENLKVWAAAALVIQLVIYAWL